MFQSFNPFTQKVVATFPLDTSADISNKIILAEQSFKYWKNTSFEDRRKIFYKVAEILEQNATEYGSIITLEIGKTIRESIAEIKKSALNCKFYAENAEKFLVPENIVSDASISYVSYEPMGVVFAIMPWNFPFWQVFRYVAPALMAGNATILKHAPNVPQCTLLIEKIFQEAGLPKGVFQNVFIEPSQVEEIIKQPIVQAVTLTGSEQAGASVAQLAGKYLKKSVLELGGSDPFIVLEDADIEEVAKYAVISRMHNNGQSCISAKRFIIPENKVAEFIEAVIKRFENLKFGNPEDPTTDFACLARNDLAEKLFQQVQKSVDLGAEILYGGQAPENAIFKPIILGKVQKGMPAYHEEFFGAVLSIISVKNEQEAIFVANDTSYGLAASIWTKDLAKGQKIAAQIEAGAVFINAVPKSDPRLPFGGIKNSGYGRELSSWGIKEFVNVKTVSVK
jgi:succinate-semialdehyde dehydrogenase / glutarate-semialdehyde dehydrogenase